jgi:endonuclease/exonuclease/phosphatase (EEP) superfamily protein YafD
VAAPLAEDRLWSLTTLNALRLYWLSPVWLLLFYALAARRYRLLPLASMLVGFWLWQFGPLWLPRLPGPAPSGGAFRVMSYNSMVLNQDVDRVMQSILDADADLVGFQELSPFLVEALEPRLADHYPYRILDVENSAVSRHPLRRTHSTLPGNWGGLSHPQVYRVSIEGRELTWINAHQFAPITVQGDSATRAILRERRRQSESIASFSRDEIESGRPVILTTDLNATDQNAVHGIVAAVLDDAWREVGFGLGHSWRAAAQLPVIGTRSGWLARIDFVFLSPDLWAQDARMGLWDGQSDHRPVIVTLRWR